jgi:chromatin remodeling complex protein RSC6
MAASKGSRGEGSVAAGGSFGRVEKLFEPSPALAEIVGKEPLSRTAVTKIIWQYIRVNKLQDPNDKRQIRADRKLKPVLGGRASISMFELPKCLAGHLAGGEIVKKGGGKT